MNFRTTALLVAALNLLWFGVEVAVALSVRSVALLADSADFLEDASVNLLVAVAAGWPAPARARVGMGLAALLLVPVLAFLWTLGRQLADPQVPEPAALSTVGAGALAINLACAVLLARFRATGGSLGRAAFLSARNDALANLAIIAAGFVTLARPSIWPDLMVGLSIALLNLDSAREVLAAARAEAGRPPRPCAK